MVGFYSHYIVPLFKKSWCSKMYGYFICKYQNNDIIKKQIDLYRCIVCISRIILIFCWCSLYKTMIRSKWFHLWNMICNLRLSCHKIEKGSLRISGGTHFLTQVRTVERALERYIFYIRAYIMSNGNLVVVILNDRLVSFWKTDFYFSVFIFSF